MLAIYILSDSTNPGRYKVGSHTGTLEKLKSRYITAIPTLVINYFIETPDAKSIEDKFKQTHINERLKNANGNTCEWVNMELHEITSSLLAIVLQCTKSKNKEVVVISKSVPENASNSSSSKEEIASPQIIQNNPFKTDIQRLPEPINQQIPFLPPLPPPISVPPVLINQQQKPLPNPKDNFQLMHHYTNFASRNMNISELVQSALAYLTEHTSGKQNVSVRCFRYVFREYIRVIKKHKTSRGEKEIIDLLVIDVMKILGYIIGERKVKIEEYIYEEYIYEEYIGLSWKDTVNQHKCISNLIHSIDNIRYNMI
jgi:DNA-binding protein Fis